MSEALFNDPRHAQLYDAACPWSEDRSYCLAFAAGRESVLDLGCGTGSLASAIAHRNGCHVEGVDPAQAMLDQAVHHAGHEKVQWVCADAREVRLGRSFDLIVMTGHAFQCFLTDDDRLALFETIAAHLSGRGQFIFDSRNPLVEEWRGWKPEISRHTFTHPSLGAVEAWDDAVFDEANQVATYEWFYRVAGSGEVLHAPGSRIAFPSKETIGALLTQSGLKVERWLGNWRGDAFTDESTEIIPLGRLAA